MCMCLDSRHTPHDTYHWHTKSPVATAAVEKTMPRKRAMAPGDLGAAAAAIFAWG